MMRIGRLASYGVAAATVVGLGVPALATSAADAAIVRGCYAKDLAISKGRLDGAAGNFYQNVRIKNVSSSHCQLAGFPTFRFQRNGTAIGFTSVPEPGQTAHVTVIPPGAVALSTMHFVDFGNVPKAACHPRTATAFTMVLPHRTHVYTLPTNVTVCTTQAWRPTAFPVHR
jgi:hypothetical protein